MVAVSPLELREETSGGARGQEHTIALIVDGTDVGRATIVLAPGAASPTSALIQDVGRVLSAPLRQLHALARVAKVSRRAYAQSRELGDRLKELLPSSRSYSLRRSSLSPRPCGGFSGKSFPQ